MQIPVHVRPRAYGLLLSGFCSLAFACNLAMAQPFGNPPPGTKLSEMKLIASPGQDQNAYHAGVEITLASEALTYWRQPGDAGVPPVFSFEGSDNLAAAEVLYPAPTRIREDEGEAFGYRDKVIFPLRLTPRDKKQPLVLKLTVDYAVCQRICVPAKSQAELTLPVAPPGDASDAELAAAEAHVPQRLSAAEALQKLALVREHGSGNPTWRLDWKATPQATDLFAEAPEGWYFETKKTAGANAFSIVAVERPKQEHSAELPVTLTLTAPGHNYEFTLPLDAAAGDR